MPSRSSDEKSVADLRIRAFCQRWLLGMREIGVADEHMACALGVRVKAIESARAGRGWAVRGALPRVFGRMGNELRTMSAADVVAWSAAVKAGDRKSAARATSGAMPDGDSGFAPLGELSAEGRHSRFVEWIDAMESAGVDEATIAGALGFNASTIKSARRKVWRGGGRLARTWRDFGDEIAAMLPEDVSEWALGVRAGWMRSAKARLAGMESGGASGSFVERGQAAARDGGEGDSGGGVGDGDAAAAVESVAAGPGAGAAEAVANGVDIASEVDEARDIGSVGAAAEGDGGKGVDAAAAIGGDVGAIIALCCEGCGRMSFGYFRRLEGDLDASSLILAAERTEVAVTCNGCDKESIWTLRRHG